MNPVIYLIGLPGTGKSTVSKHLGSQPGFVSITNEDIRRKLCFSGYNSKDTEKIRNEGRQNATSILEQGSIPVLDGVCSSVNGRRHDIEFFGELGGIIYVECTCSQALAIARIQNRPPHKDIFGNHNDPSLYHKYEEKRVLFDPQIEDLKGVTSFLIFDTQEKSITLAYATRESHRRIIRLLYSAIADFCISNLGCQIAGKTSQGVAGENRPHLR